MGFRLVDNCYGKGDVRLTRLFRRPGGVFDVMQMSVQVRLAGDFEASYTVGDNTQVIATDSMKNTVYVLARRHEFASPEDFGHILVEHFLKTYPHVSRAEVHLGALPYQRLTVDGVPHPHAFVGSGPVRQTFSIVLPRGGAPTTLQQGIDGLLLFKATASEFTDFVTDEYRTLPDSRERIFSTVVKGTWSFASRPADYNGARDAVQGALIKVFAEHYSLAVQQTLQAMGEAALAACPSASTITLVLPNKHHLPVNLAPFGLDNPHMVFQPIDEPYGLIEGTIGRT